jgi:hypothetical protein
VDLVTPFGDGAMKAAAHVMAARRRMSFLVGLSSQI